MPAAVIAREGVNLIDDHDAQVAEQTAGIDLRRHQHHFQRLGSGQETIGRVTQNLHTCRLLHVAVPQGRSPPQELAVPL
jgi:hypothetical protein